jgi:hypothetical protein
MKFKALFLLLFVNSVCFANSWVRNAEVVQIGSYHRNPGHYVWLSAAVPECAAANPSNPVIVFSDSEAGGKGLMTVLTTALIAKRKVDVNVNGCDINEVYLK